MRNLVFLKETNQRSVSEKAQFLSSGIVLYSWIFNLGI